MTPYPATLPLDAINLIINDFTTKAFVTDREKLAKAAWELAGYGLKLGLGDPTPVSFQSEPPLSDEQLVEHLKAVRDHASAPAGTCDALPPVLALLPWKAILRWALTMILAAL